MALVDDFTVAHAQIAFLILETTMASQTGMHSPGSAMKMFFLADLQPSELRA